MLFANTPRSRRNKSRLASACGQAVETLESRRLLSITGLNITSITSSADADGGAGGAEHVTVVPGSTVTVHFAYSSTAGNVTTAKFNLDTSPTTVTTPQGGVVSSGANQTASLSVVIPLNTVAGTYSAHVQVKNGLGAGSTRNVSCDTVDVVLTVAPVATTLTISAADVTYNASAYSESNITANLTPADALGSITYQFFDSQDNPISAPTNAGTYKVQGHFASSNLAKWLNADSNIVEFEIAKAPLTGIATTQNALNIVKQGTLTIAISSIAGLQGADTLVDAFSTATFKLSIGGDDYVFQPTVSIDALTNVVYVSYAMKDGTAAADALRECLSDLELADGSANTSASDAPYSTLSLFAESTNYTFSDDFLTRLFCSAK